MKHIVVIFLFALCALTGCGKKNRVPKHRAALPVFVVSVDSLPAQNAVYRSDIEHSQRDNTAAYKRVSAID